jgi:hypothetical protein
MFASEPGAVMLSPPKASNDTPGQPTQPDFHSQPVSSKSGNGSTGNGFTLTSATNQGDGYQQAQQILTQRGVTYQRLETTDNGLWHFICSIPDRQSGEVSKYEASLPGEGGLAAIRAVLNQIDQERR